MSLKVLVVEDDPDIMMAIVDGLEDLGHEPVSALDLSVAEALSVAGKPDIAIVDHELPDGAGAEFAAKLRDQGVGKIVMFTGRGEQEIVMTAIDNGVIDYVLKGSGVDELLDRVSKHAAQVA